MLVKGNLFLHDRDLVLRKLARLKNEVFFFAKIGKENFGIFFYARVLYQTRHRAEMKVKRFRLLLIGSIKQIFVKDDLLAEESFLKIIIKLFTGKLIFNFYGGIIVDRSYFVLFVKLQNCIFVGLEILLFN